MQRTIDLEDGFRDGQRGFYRQLVYSQCTLETDLWVWKCLCHTGRITLSCQGPWRYRRRQTSRGKGASLVLTDPGSKEVQTIYSSVLSPEALKQL